MFLRLRSIHSWQEIHKEVTFPFQKTEQVQRESTSGPERSVNVCRKALWEQTGTRLSAAEIFLRAVLTW